MVSKVNLAEKFASIDEYWKPKIVGELDDHYVKIVRIKGDFVMHRHEDADEMFLVVKGQILLRIRDEVLRLKEGEFAIVPQAVEHAPLAEEEAHVMLVERRSVVNTGEVRNARTVEAEWI